MPSNLILTDRSRIVDGFKCPMKRFLAYHSMANGYGMVRSSQAMPLATGIIFHQAMENILKLQMLQETLVDPLVVDTALSTAVRNYQLMIRERGFLDIEETQGQTMWVLAEQTALVSGLVWAWYFHRLPEMIRLYQIIEVEEEHTLQVGRVGVMCRPDFVCRDRVTGALSIHDWKTASYAPDPADWADSPQMALGTLAVEQDLAEPVESFCMHVLIKGQRKQSYQESTRAYDGPKQQQSIFCYGYQKLPTPPFDTEEIWYPTHERLEDGKSRKNTEKQGYQRVPVWEHMDAKTWVELLSEDPYKRSHVFKAIPSYGPYERQSDTLDKLVESIQITEESWLRDRHAAFELIRRYPWESEDYQKRLTKLIPRSFQCRDFKSDCPFKQLCYHHYGWKELGDYKPRRPHHEQEIEEMKERGIEVPKEPWEEEGE